MKKVLALLFAFTSQTLAQTSATFVWNASPDAVVNGYAVYYRPLGQTNFLSTNVLASVTNVTIPVVPNTVYEAYVTATAGGGLESDPSNKVRYQNFFVSGNSKATPLTLGDFGSSNFTSFTLSLSPINGTVNGTPPSVTFTPTMSFGAKDIFVYRSPETFQGLNVTNYYVVYKVQINQPPVIISVK